MASNAATNAVLLQVLDRHLQSKPHEQVEIIINGANYEIVSSTLDLLMKDTASSLLAARIILTVRDISRRLEGARDQPTTELAAHITTNGPDASPTSYRTVILDDTPLTRDGSSPEAAGPQRASTIPTHSPPGTTTTTSRRRPLAEIYRDYIPAFMTPDPAAAEANLARFLHQPVTHNTRALPVPEYHGLGSVVRESIPDIGCEILDLIADEERQVVAARLEFAGTLVGPFAGREPPVGGGRAVRIGEIVFYWFDEGKIRDVVSLVNLDGLGPES